MLATCGYKNGAYVWDVPSGRLLRILAREQQIRVARFSPDGKTLATASRDGLVRLWDATNFMPVGVPMAHAKEVMTIAFSPNGRDLLTGCDGAIWRWDALKCTPTGPNLPHIGVVWTISFSEDGDRFLSVAGTPYADWGYVRVWQASTMRPFGPPLAQRASISAVAFRPASTLIAIGGWEGDVRLWDVARGQPVGPALPLGGTVTALAFDRLGKRLAVAGENGHCRIWTIPDPVIGTPSQVQNWVESLTGLELDSDGAKRPRTPLPKPPTR
jgi:WD40 repeat protein